MNNRQLTIFRTVCEEGSMTKAAEKLYMTQPAVSQTIKELEQESGVCFLERYNRKVVPTESGRLLYQYACHILGLYQDLEQHLKETEGVRTIRIGANLSVGVKMLRGFIRAFEKKYPDIQVKVKVSGSVWLMELLKTHQIDLGLMEDLPGETDYIQEPFAKDRTLIVAAPDHPLAGKEHVRFEDLKKENFLLREKGAGVRDRFEAILRTKDCVIDPLWESRSTKVLVQAVEDGFGISVLPYCLTAALVLIILLVLWNKIGNLNLVYHPHKVWNDPLRDFMDIVRWYGHDEIRAMKTTDGMFHGQTDTNTLLL